MSGKINPFLESQLIKKEEELTDVVSSSEEPQVDNTLLDDQKPSQVSETQPDSSDNSVDDTVEESNEDQLGSVQTGEEYFSFYEDDSSQGTNLETTQESSQEVPVKAKVKYDFKEYVDQYEETLSKYFKYKGVDPESMSNEELLRFKLKQENPTWTEEDIKDELKDTFGLGLKLREIPEDALYEDRERIEQYNETIKDRIRRGERLLKAEVLKAKNILKEEQSKLELPELELDLETTANPQQVIESYQQQLQEQNNKYLEEIWKPSISEAVNKLGGFKQPLEIDVEEGDKVVSELNYKLTPEQKSKLTEYLNSYSGHPSDEVYIKDKETGEVDYQRFVSDKAMSLFAKDIIKASVKEATAKLKEKLVKEKLVNFADEPRRVVKNQEGSKDFASKVFERLEKMGSRR